jgi:outer membrane receptor protein involved in Fe transport
MRRTAIYISLSLLFTVSGWGQTLTGTILGTATDSSGAVLPGVEITITNTATNQQREVVTGSAGSYSAVNLAVGQYQAAATLEGFSTTQVNDITLQIGDSRRVDFSLEVGQVTLVIEVTGEDWLMQTDESSVGSVISSEMITGLPLNGRNFETLVQLLPGSVSAAQGSEIGTRGGFNISGYDENFNSFFMDGFDNVDPVLRNFSFRPSVDLVQEFQVLQNSYKAEFGRNAGAVINVTTKSGTNAFHGSAWEFLRNDNLDARNVFASEGQKPDLLRNQFGAAIGGPIVRDKAFFFVAYEGLRAKLGETHRAFVPTLLMRGGDFSELGEPIVDPVSGLAFPGNLIPTGRMNPITRNVIEEYPLPNVSGASLTSPNRIEIANQIDDTDDISARVDTQLFGNTQMLARYSFSNSRILDPFRSATTGGTNLKDFGQSNDIIRTNTGVGFTTIIDANLVHEFRFGYNRFKQPQLPLRSLPSEQAPIAGVVKKFLNFSPSGFEAIGSGREFERVVNVYNYIDQMSWTTGTHQFKFGVDVRRYLFNAFSGQTNQFLFGGITASPLADMFLGFPASATVFGGDPAGNSRKTEAAAYVQDDWKVTSYLTLNYGLRYEWYGRILENVDKQSNWDPANNSIVIAGQDVSRQLVDDDYNNWAPRFGFALRPFSSDTTVIRGGYGIYYDSQMRHNFFQIANYPFAITSSFRQTPTLDLTIDGPFPADTPASIIPFALEEDYNDSYAQHWNLGVQHEILRNTVLDVSYVGNHFVKVSRFRNVNQPTGFVAPYGFGPHIVILLQEQAGSSNYHALQVRAEGRPMDRMTFISSYLGARNR